MDRRQIARTCFALLIITGCAFVIYSNIYNCPFVFDGAHEIEKNRKIRNLDNYLSYSELIKPRAIVYLTFGLNYAFSKLEPFGYHFVNIVIHAINGFMVYFLTLMILKLTYSQSKDPSRQPAGSRIGATSIQPAMYPISLFTALIFTAHPLQVQAVTYTVQRCASMAAMFYLGSLFFYLKARVSQKSGSRGGAPLISVYFVLAAVFGILAFLSKANAASLPGVIVLSEYLFVDQRWRTWKKTLPWFIVVFILWFFFLSYISGVFSGGIRDIDLLEDVSSHMRETSEVGRWVYLCTQFNVIIHYIRLLVFPVGQSVDPMYPFVRGFFHGYTPLAFLFLVGLIVFGVWNIRRQRIISFCILWFFITLSVESSILPIRDAMFEHRLYLPMYGYAFALSYMGFNLLSKRRVTAIIIFTAIVVALSVTTYFRNKVWENKMTLWSDALAKNPTNFRAYLGLGVPFMEKGMYDKAIRHYSKAMKINPVWALPYYNMGVLKESKGKYHEAMKYYSEAVRLRPTYAEAHSNLGTIFLHMGDLDAAQEHYQAAIQSDPDFATAHSNLGIVLTRKGKLDDAIYHFGEALRLRPEDDRIRYNLDQVIKQREKSEDAPG